VSLFLTQLGVISVALSCENEKVGEIRFETFEEAPTDESEIDPNYPHVKPRCVVCKDTHRSDKGTPYQCRYCVCLRCNGTGIANNKTECKTMKLM
jgi:hypothetical protein